MKPIASRRSSLIRVGHGRAALVRAHRGLIALAVALPLWGCAQPADEDNNSGEGGNNGGAGSNGGPAGSNGGPAGSSGGPAGRGGGPAGSNGGPAGSSGEPAGRGGGPAGSNGGPAGSNGGPAGSNGGPAGSNGGPAGRGGGAAGSGGAGVAGSGGSGAGGRGGSGGSGAGGRGGSAGSGSGGSGATGGSGTPGTCPTDAEEKFSFFVISNAELIRQGGADSSGMYSKFGGNLGGIAGADKICQTAAEHESPCQSNKVWHAFLGTTTQDPIDRIGTGPWYDRKGRLWSANLTNLVKDRPSDADPAIKNDVPNETGQLNQSPNGTTKVDNHQTLTGAGSNGRTYTQSTTSGANLSATWCGPDVGGSGNAWSPERATCWNWTRNTPEGCPRVGHTWCMAASCTPAGGGSGTNWMSVWNESGCAPGGTLVQTGGTDTSRKIGSAGGYGGFYCFAVIPRP